MQPIASSNPLGQGHATGTALAGYQMLHLIHLVKDVRQEQLLLAVKSFI